MPRNYAPYTPSGDPSNPLSLLSPSVNIPQVNFTAQTAVAEPENQFETLQKILGLAAGAAKSVLDYKTNTIQNEMAVNNAIERAQAKEEAAQEKAIREEERAQYKAERAKARQEALEKEAQDGVLNSYDARITAALLKEDFDEAQRLGDEFARLYPTEKNPFMSNKAQDQLLRIKNTRKVYDNSLEQDLRVMSAASRGAVTSDLLADIEGVNGKFASNETRGQVMDIWKNVPEDQLHIGMTKYFMDRVPLEKMVLMNEEDRTELSATILRQTDRLRTEIIRERNAQRTLDRIEMRSKGAIEVAVGLRSDPNTIGDKLGILFREFDSIGADRENGMIGAADANRLESNLVIAIGQNAGRETPVAGAILFADIIQAGIDRGDIPLARGQKVIEVLRRRANAEMSGVISKIKQDAVAAPNVNEATSLYEVSPNENPATRIAETSGIYETLDDGTVRIRSGMEPLAKQVDALSKEWVRQKEAYDKAKGIAGNIDTIDHSFMVDTEVKEIDAALAADPELTAEDRSVAMTNIVMREFNSFLAFAQDPTGRERHAIALKRSIDKELGSVASATDPSKMMTVTVKGGRKLSVPDYIARDPLFQEWVAKADAGDLQGLSQDLIKYFDRDVATADGMVGYTNRTTWLYGMDLLMNNSMSESQKRTASNPTLARTYSQQELSEVANSSSIALRKNSAKMNNIQRELEEERVGRLVAASASVPQDWIKHISDNYFQVGSGEANLQRGYDLILRSRGTVIDQNGVQVNFASIGTVASEIAMQQENPVMYETLVIAEGLSIGTNKAPSEFLGEAHRIAVQRNALMESQKGLAKTQGELLPTPFINPQSGLPMRDSSTLYGKRLEGMRTAFQEVFNKDIPRQGFDAAGIDNDPYFSLDVEDYNRMNAVFQGFKAKGYPDDLAIKAAVATMKKIGYSMVTNESQAGTTVGMVFDPYGVNPPDEVKKGFEFLHWVETKVKQGSGVNINLTGGDARTRGQVKFLMTSDLTTPDSKVPFVIILPDGNRMEFTGNNGINYRDYLKYIEEQRISEEANRVSFSL